jgi:hypothetical protein
LGLLNSAPSFGGCKLPRLRGIIFPGTPYRLVHINFPLSQAPRTRGILREIEDRVTEKNS